MFTGIVKELGRIASVEGGADGVRLELDAPETAPQVGRGDSVSLNGVCLTVVAVDGPRLTFEAVPETLARTTLGALVSGDPVNLERPLTLAQRLGGHLVQGHVDGVGEVVSVANEGDGCRVRLRVPAELRRFVAEKGSLTVDGVSLTVAAVTDDGCEIAYIPHTLAVTTSGTYQSGRRVNLEVDLLARYLARLLEDAGSSRRSL